MDFKLDIGEIKLLEKYHKNIHDKKLADRVKCVIALAKGYSFDQIKEILLIEERTARRYFKIFKEQGPDGLLVFNYRGRIPKLKPQFEEELIKHIDQNIYASSMEIVEYIKRTYNVEYTHDGLVIALHRLGFSFKKTKTVPAKADRKKQEKFIEFYKKLREQSKDSEKTYFMDGVHPTHNVMPAYAWIKKGKDKEVKSNTGRQRVNINGAYSPDDQDIIVRKDKSINAQSTIELFKMIEKKNPDKSVIYVISDNARYYSANLVKEYLLDSKITLIHLPSYSPNLNLIERLWKFFKKKVVYNKYYETLSDFENAIDDFFDKRITIYKDEIKKLLAENFHLFENS